MFRYYYGGVQIDGQFICIRYVGSYFWSDSFQFSSVGSFRLPHVLCWWFSGIVVMQEEIFGDVLLQRLPVIV